MISIAALHDLTSDTEIHASVVIVGSGFAGQEVARALVEKGIDTLILEAGGPNMDQSAGIAETAGSEKTSTNPKTMKFNKHLSPELRNNVQVQQFGGLSTLWSGKWKALEPCDFYNREDLGHAGWPIDYADIEPFYRGVAKDFGLDIQRPSSYRNEEAKVSSDLKFPFHIEEKNPTRLNSSSLEVLDGPGNLDVLFNSFVVNITQSDDLGSVTTLQVKDKTGVMHNISAEHFVLAIGGIQIPRLLLASNKQSPNGVGNTNDLVGRYFMDHPKTKVGRFIPSGETVLPNGFHPDKTSDQFQQLSISLSNTVLEHDGLPNHNAYLWPVYGHSLNYPHDEMQSLKAEIKKRNVVAMFSSIFRMAMHPKKVGAVLQNILKKGPLPISHYSLMMYLEQLPNPESRVLLVDTQDQNGVPRAQVKQQFLPSEERLLWRFVEKLGRVIQEAGLGKIEIENVKPTLDEFSGANHFMGTTRMSTDPDGGVVDANCTVWGIDNLHIASASVFPTGGNANPTLSLVALSRRLGHHLAELCSVQEN